MSETHCDNDPEQRHHFHDLSPSDPNYPSSVCCYCGDLFLPDGDADGPCGEFAPKTTLTSVESQALDALMTWRQMNEARRAVLATEHNDRTVEVAVANVEWAVDRMAEAADAVAAEREVQRGA